MTAPVDVLAVLDDAAHKLRHGVGSVPAQMAVSDELRQARAAVAELVEAAGLVANYQSSGDVVSELPTRAAQFRRLRAAIAKFGGAA